MVKETILWTLQMERRNKYCILWDKIRALISQFRIQNSINCVCNGHENHCGLPELDMKVINGKFTPFLRFTTTTHYRGRHRDTILPFLNSG